MSLATFALFAHNQERYINEAFEVTFVQTYELIEIIISDEYWTDRTFEMMQEIDPPPMKWSTLRYAFRQT
jgi:hypothetical protein